MTALSAARTFNTFHSNTTALPAEITTQIIVADAQPLPLGGGVTTHSTHYPIASVSQTLRSIYLDHPYSPSTKGKTTAPIKLKISETLEFSDLRSLAAFFEDGPSRNAAIPHNVRSLSISYIDDHTAIGWGRWTTDYAYEAFEHLHRNWDLMRISWLRLHLPYSQAISSVDDPGVWCLLKIRNLRHLNILGPYCCIASNVRKCLRAQTHKKNLFPWRPLGLENAGGKDWLHRQGQTPWQVQYEWLETRYKYLHHRGIVTKRRAKQRQAYHKRQK